jgi:hypothetical protein
MEGHEIVQMPEKEVPCIVTPLPCLPEAVTQFPIIPSTCVAILSRKVNHIRTLASNKHFGLRYIDQRELEGNRAEGRE